MNSSKPAKHGDLRLSTKYRNRSVNEILAQTLPVTFALGGLAPMTAFAGEGCEYGGHATKKNDVETPQPAASAVPTKKQS